MVSAATTSAPGGMLPISCVNRLDALLLHQPGRVAVDQRLLEPLARRLAPVDLPDDAAIADGEQTYPPTAASAGSGKL